MGSSVFLGAFAYLIVRGKHELHIKVLSVGLALLLLVAVCWSRVYLGVHWLTDVIAGAGLGAVWLLAAILPRRSDGGRAVFAAITRRSSCAYTISLV
jgi:membrane-associated phospholipid phosphatase